MIIMLPQNGNGFSHFLLVIFIQYHCINIRMGEDGNFNVIKMIEYIIFFKVT